MRDHGERHARLRLGQRVRERGERSPLLLVRRAGSASTETGGTAPRMPHAARDHRSPRHGMAPPRRTRSGWMSAPVLFLPTDVFYCRRCSSPYLAVAEAAGMYPWQSVTAEIEPAEAGEQTPASIQGTPGHQQVPVTRSPKAMSTKNTRQKQVIFVEDTSQHVVSGFSHVTPAEASPQAIATFVRKHRALENRRHWRRDVTLREDQSQVRTAGKPPVLAALNTIVLTLMDWPGVRHVPDHMRLFAAFPTLASGLFRGPLTFD
jgi:predicted transposase YbfD/YdcC